MGQPLFLARFDGPSHNLPVHTPDKQRAFRYESPKIAHQAIAGLDPTETRYVVVEFQLVHESIEYDDVDQYGSGPGTVV